MTSNDEDRDGRSSMARGYVLYSRVTGIAMQMALPPGVGWWIDGKLGTTPWFLIGGVVLGFSISMLELIRFAKESEAEEKAGKKSSESS